ncbi:MAG: tetratricopeptide repeat protein [Blastocatellia bacterium]|nr:tetratricopeptide repeat protein [Blastocatellia bacterium]
MKIRTLLMACALLAFASIAAFAQVGRIEGDVIKADTKEPIVGAEVVIERTDIKGSYPVKSDKKGHFLHAGVPFVGTYTVMISAPGCEPTFLTGIRPDREQLKVELRPGDGRKLTMDDVKSTQASMKSGGGGAPQKQISEAEAKKQQAEYEKKRKEIEEQNKKLQADFEGMKKFFESGLAKMTAKDYAGAAADLNEAAKLDAEQYAIWANLALALFNKGVTDFNESTKDPARRDPAKQAFNDAINASGKAIALTEPKLADPAKAPEAKKQMVTSVKIKADAEGLLAKRLGVMEMVDPAVKDYQQIAEMAELPADKLKYQLAGAEVLFDSGKAEEAVAAYTAILATNVDNPDALYKLGLAYASVAKFQESANTFQKFLDRAPETDPRVPEVKAVLKDLVVGNNLQPPKSEGKKAPARGKKP